jgi:hypothetical protein
VAAWPHDTPSSSSQLPQHLQTASAVSGWAYDDVISPMVSLAARYVMKFEGLQRDVTVFERVSVRASMLRIFYEAIGRNKIGQKKSREKSLQFAVLGFMFVPPEHLH